MKNMRTLITFLLALALLSGCDIIDMPQNDNAHPVNPVTGLTRRVLLEDCTGARCPNCPTAADLAESIQNFYNTNEERVIVVDINMVAQFSAPLAPDYTTDFRTPAGDEYATHYNLSVIGLPSGLINRMPYGGVVPQGAGSWSSAVAAVIDLPPDMDVWFDSFNFNSATNVVTTTVKVAVINAINGPHNLTVYLTEDHVIDWQEDVRLPLGQQNVPDYDHRHVLRDNLNGTWGDVIIPTSAQPGDTLSESFTYTLPPAGAINHVINTANCSLVAYVYSTSGADADEVKQVAERKFVP